MGRQTVRILKSLNDLTLDSRNANRGTERGQVLIAKSLTQCQAGRSILVDRQGRVIAGNKTAEAARQQGRPLLVVQTRGEELVAVQRVDLDLDADPAARELALADNRIAELDLAWDPAVLAQMQAEGFDLSRFWTPEELAAVLPDEARGGLTDENAVVMPRATGIHSGDLFALGRHRLLCGDATAPADVDRLLTGDAPRLMVTDPPYGVSYDPAWRHRVYPRQRTAVGRVANDDRADWSAAWRLFPGPVAYVWHAALHAATVAASLVAAGFGLRSQIIWRKQHFTLGRGDFHWAHEPAWYVVRKGATSHWRGGRTQSTVWEVPNLNPIGGTRAAENAVTGHSTQKPTALFEIPIRNHTTARDLIYDPFAGSGTAIIAAERLGRTCLAMDIDPIYVQAAIDRWEAYTGAHATRVGTAPRRRRRAQ